MPRYNVKTPDGRWRVFSSVCDGKKYRKGM